MYTIIIIGVESKCTWGGGGGGGGEGLTIAILTGRRVQIYSFLAENIGGGYAPPLPSPLLIMSTHNFTMMSFLELEYKRTHLCYEFQQKARNYRSLESVVHDIVCNKYIIITVHSDHVHGF